MPSRPSIIETTAPDPVVTIVTTEVSAERDRCLADAKQQIVADLDAIGRRSEVVHISQLAIWLGLALVLSIIATVGLVIAVVGLRSGSDASGFLDAIALLSTGGSGLVTAGVVLMLKRFQTTARGWLNEKEQRAIFINQVRTADTIDKLRRVLDKHDDNQAHGKKAGNADLRLPGRASER
jgi:hypothetical protein